MRIMDAVMAGLARALDLREQRQRLLTQNIANADTPGYRARELDFRQALKAAFGEGTGPQGKSSPGAPVISDPDGILREDGNTVDLDRQMLKLYTNAGRYRVLSRILSRKFDMVRMAIEESRR